MLLELNIYDKGTLRCTINNGHLNATARQLGIAIQNSLLDYFSDANGSYKGNYQKVVSIE